MYFKLMKNVPIKLKPGVVPHIFDCQKQRQTTHKKSPRKAFIKRQRRRELEEPSTSAKRICLTASPEHSNETNDQEDFQVCEFRRTDKADKRIQVNLKVKTTSKSTQCDLLKKPKKAKIQTEVRSDVDSSSGNNSPSDSSESFKMILSSLSDVEDVNSEIWNFKENVQQRTIYLIEKNPKLYLGLPIQSLFIIDKLSTLCRLTKLEIYVTLKKLNLTFHTKY